MKAVFLDRDGVINHNRANHVTAWREFRFLPRAPEAVALFSHAGVPVFVITNQAVVNRGTVGRETIDAINARMVSEIEHRGGRVEEVAYCPHRPDEHCGCRKPQPGLLFDLAARYRIELSESVVVGDALSDIEAGQAAGCRTVLVLTGRGEEQLRMARAAGYNGFAVARDLFEAAHLLLRSPLLAPPELAIPQTVLPWQSPEVSGIALGGVA